MKNMKKLFFSMMFLAGALCTWAQTVVIDHMIRTRLAMLLPHAGKLTGMENV